MQDSKGARTLLAAANNDLKALDGMVADTETFTEEVFGFHAQQAAEKTLKAWLAGLGEQYPLTHDIGELLERLEKRGCDVEQLWDLVELSPFGVALRYSVLDEAERCLDRRATLQTVKDIYEHVSALLEDGETGW